MDRPGEKFIDRVINFMGKWIFGESVDMLAERRAREAAALDAAAEERLIDNLPTPPATDEVMTKNTHGTPHPPKDAQPLAWTPMHGNYGGFAECFGKRRPSRPTGIEESI